MKKIIIILCFIMAFNLIIVSNNSMSIGYDDIIWLKEDYQGVRACTEGLFAVSVKDGYNEKWGFINTKGEEVIPLKFDYVGSFNDGFAFVELNGRYGYVDKTGGMILSQEYEGMSSFSEGLAKVVKGDSILNPNEGFNKEYGFINKDGNKVIEFKYMLSDDFSEGLAAVAIGDYNSPKWGYINMEGDLKINNKYSVANMFKDGFAVVGVGSSPRFGFIDKTGKEITKIGYNYAGDFNEGLAAVSNGKMGYIDRTGKEVISKRYDWAGDFNEGLASVLVGHKQGYIDRTGKTVIPIKYDKAGNFNDGMARVQIGDKFGYIDKTGKEIVPIKYKQSATSVYYNYNEGLVSFQLDGKYGSLDKKGNEIVPFKYDYIGKFSEGFATVLLDGKRGIMKSPLEKELERQKDEPSNWGKKDIERALELGLVTEKIKGNYRDNITRIEFAELITNMMEKIIGRQLVYEDINVFNDTQDINVLKAYGSGVITGVNADEFAPGLQITREQIATIFYRSIDYIENDRNEQYLIRNYNLSKYSDGSKISNWSKMPVGVLTNNEIIKGISDTEFGYRNPVTKEQAIILVLRTYKFIIK